MKKKAVSILMTAAMAASMLATTTEASTEAFDPGTGKVYLLNFKPETDEAWQNLASDYSSQYGVDVTVLTAADGQYNTTLTSEMAKSDAPTIFTVGNATAAQTWNDYTYDLKDTPLYSHLTCKLLRVLWYHLQQDDPE